MVTVLGGLAEFERDLICIFGLLRLITACVMCVCPATTECRRSKWEEMGDDEDATCWCCPPATASMSCSCKAAAISE